jgi:transposase
MNGLKYILSTGCRWRAIPKDLAPPCSTIYDYFDRWQWDGTIADKQTLLEELTAWKNTAIRRTSKPIGGSPPPPPGLS